MGTKKDVAVVDAAPTDRELVRQRVVETNGAINDFVATLFDGVRSKVADLRTELSAEMLAQRVSDAMVRLGEINLEVSALATEAAQAPDDITYRLLLTRIAILKTSFAARYKAAVGLVPGGPDEGTIGKEVQKLFDGVAKDIADRRKKAASDPFGGAPAEEVGVLTLPDPAEVTLVTLDPPAGPASPPDSWAYDPDAGEGETTEAEANAAAEQIEEILEAAAGEAEVAAEVLAGQTAPTPPASTEPVPSVVPSVGLPMFKHKSKNGRHSHARA